MLNDITENEELTQAANISMGSGCRLIPGPWWLRGRGDRGATRREAAFGNGINCPRF